MGSSTTRSSEERRKWSGVFPAIPTLFQENGDLDTDSLASYVDWLLSHESVRGIVCHAHAGEVTNLTVDEMEVVTETVVQAATGRVPVVAAVQAEGVHPAVAIAKRLEARGADALLVMPPHHWLRFGKTLDETMAYIGGLAARTDLPLIIHEYPLSTKAGYSLPEVLAFARIPTVVALKSGTRDIAAYTARIPVFRREVPWFSILNCHDEAMLPTLIQGVDGVLVALGSLIPDELAEMQAAADRGDLNAARAVERRVAPMVEVMYGASQPTGRSHALLKAALHVLGLVPNAVVRPPVLPVTPEELARVAHALEASGVRPTAAIA
ncbi:MAG: dihydrodipicolinate synthase family protein [Chloroflexota bacterium]